MNKNLVSIVVPCYNVAKYIERFLNSLLAQTYKNLEVVFVNDGSTDDTERLIQEYIPLLEKEAYSVVYVKQENGGQAAAINTGIKRVSGEFLTWPDPDDWLTPDSIEKRVLFLQEHPEVGIVRSNIEKICDKTKNSLGLYETGIEKAQHIENFFEKARDIKTWFAPLAYMVRMSFFNTVNPEHDIYVSRKGGQNIQMLLPLAKKFPCWQMPDVLGYYLIRDNSHSRSQKSFADIIDYEDTTEDVVISTLSRMNAGEKMICDIRKQYAWKRILQAKRHGSTSDILFYVRKAWPVADEKVLLILAPILPRCIFRFFRNMIPGISKS